MGTILPITRRYSCGNNVVNRGLSGSIADMLTSQHAGVIIPHSNLFFLILIEAITIMLYSISATTKSGVLVASILYQITLWTSTSRKDTMICCPPNMTIFTLPIRLCVGVWRICPKPNESPNCCKFQIVGFGKSLFSVTFWTSISGRNTMVTCIPNMPPSTFPHCLGVGILRKFSNPFKSNRIGKINIVLFFESLHVYIKRCLLSAASCLDIAVTIGTDSIIHRFLAMSRQNNCTISRRFVNQTI